MTAPPENPSPPADDARRGPGPDGSGEGPAGTDDERGRTTDEPAPEGLLLPDGSTVGGRDERAPEGDDRLHFSPRAVMARVPVRRITRVQAIALVVFSLIALGPLVALVAVMRTDTAELPIVVEEDKITAEDGLILTMTVTSVNAVTREMGVRMAISSSSAGPKGLIEGGRMTETVNLGLPAEGSTQGSSTITLAKGSTVGAVEFVTPLEDGTIARYPYDTYSAEIVVIASREGDGELGPTSSATPASTESTESTGPAGSTGSTGSGSTGSTGSQPGSGSGGSGTPTRIPVPISVIVAADVPGFVVNGELPPDQASSTASVDLGVRRNGPTLLYTTWIMLLWWALSVSAVLLVWAVAIWRSSPPPWAYGYLVGVLFALAPLRGALPGQPPSGVLVDYVSFYWAVGTLGIGLLLLVSFFLRDARIEGRNRSRAEEERLDRTADASYDTGETPAVDVAPAPTTPPLPIPLGTEPVVAEDAQDRRDDG